jgi:hypothetical protein
VKSGAAVALGLAACAPGNGPRIERVEPAQAVRGATVTVFGEQFSGEGRAADDGSCTTLPPGSVVFGLELPAARADVLSWSDGAIGVTVPAAAVTGELEVIVTVDGRSSDGGAFEVLP